MSQQTASENETPEQPMASQTFPSRALVVFTLSAALLGLLDSRRLSGFLERLELPGARQGAELVREAAQLTGATLISDAEARLLRQLTPDLILGGATAESVPLPVVSPQPQQPTVSASVSVEHNATLPPSENLSETVPVTPEEPALPPVQTEKPKVLIVGDSLIMEGLGPSLLRTLRKNPNLQVHREGRYSTGLTRTDTFDWPRHMSTLIPEKKPDLVIVCLGANDFQDILIEGKRHIAGTESWNGLYRERADTFLAQATSLGAQVVWLGLPIMGSETYEKRVRGLSGLQQAACESIAPMCLFTNNVGVLADKDGKYLSHTVDATGKHVRLRYKDKIHVTEPAGQMITDAVLPLLNELLQPKVESFITYQKEQAELAKEAEQAQQDLTVPPSAPQPTAPPSPAPSQPAPSPTVS